MHIIGRIAALARCDLLVQTE